LLGTRYTEAMQAKYLDESGTATPIVMGCYGIGVSRLVATVVEQHHDVNGIRWPMAVAPYQVHIVATGKDDAVFEVASALAAELDAADVEVCYDDRFKVSPGVKFKDAELIGAPFILVVGRGLETGVVELKTRATGTAENLPVDGVASVVRARVAEALA